MLTSGMEHCTLQIRAGKTKFTSAIVQSVDIADQLGWMNNIIFSLSQLTGLTHDCIGLVLRGPVARILGLSVLVKEILRPPV